ncbi:MAG: patatin family protein [Paludibacteraceae bacterium]
MKTALVLEGGAMRGLYTAGALDVLLDNDIEADAIYATSAGVLFGVNYISKQRGRTLRYNKRYAADPRYMGLRSLFTTGNIINKDFAYYEIPFKLDVFDQKTFAKSRTKLYATVTNVRTGQTEYKKIDDVLQQMEVLRATSAMPFVSQMVQIDHELYLDGGLTDSIPIERCLHDGYDKVIVILTRPTDYRKKAMNPLLANIVYRKYPRLIDAIRNRHTMYNAQTATIEELEHRGNIIVIRPTQHLKIGRIEKNPDKLQAMYDLGVHDTQVLLPSLKTYCQE